MTMALFAALSSVLRSSSGVTMDGLVLAFPVGVTGPDDVDGTAGVEGEAAAGGDAHRLCDERAATAAATDEVTGAASEDA